MNDTADRYWFHIDPYVHVSVKKGRFLLYNPLNGKTLEYDDRPWLTKLVRNMLVDHNLRVIGVTRDELENPLLNDFVSKVRETFMGDLIDADGSTKKPIQMVPFVKIHSEVLGRHGEKEGGFSKRNERSRVASTEREIMHYLNAISFFINESCELDCSFCKRAYKQFPCCTKTKRGARSLSISAIENLLEQAKGSFLGGFNILGGDIFRYPSLDELVSLLDPHPAVKVYYANYLNVAVEGEKLNLLRRDRTKLKVLVSAPYQEEELSLAMEHMKRAELKSRLLFIIQNDADLEAARDTGRALGIKASGLLPCYDGENMDFFEKYVFVDKADICESQPSSNDIQKNSKIHKHDFGKLTVMPSGKVYANLNRGSLGSLESDTLHDMVARELREGKSWLRTRNKVKPCRDCTYEFLCPPLSNYSYAMKRNNLCHVTPMSDGTG